MASIDLKARPQLLWWFALLAGTSYFVAERVGVSGADMTVWKTAGVGLLALWAARHADGTEGLAIAAVLAVGAVGDALVAEHGLIVGAVAFLIGHLLAIAVYARGRWSDGWSRVAVSAGLVAAAAVALTGSMHAMVYAGALGGMAGAASLGRLGRGVTVGAWLFVVSDLLLLARLNVLADSMAPALLVWPTYFAGQALIAWGAVSTLAAERRDDAAPRAPHLERR